MAKLSAALIKLEFNEWQQEKNKHNDIKPFGKRIALKYNITDKSISDEQDNNLVFLGLLMNHVKE
tara:strand:+ start:789 stop:983 length:195 start_codon:yes stop_codon:yes gene_type:complete